MKLRLLTLAATLALAAPAAAAQDPQLIQSDDLSPRLRELTFKTSALAAPTKVRILLPAGYDPRGEHRYPVLYLLHGASGDQTSWTSAGQGEAEQLIAERDASVPLGKQMGTGWDVAHAALFLASDEARFITGALLCVDGGQSLRRG